MERCTENVALFIDVLYIIKLKGKQWHTMLGKFYTFLDAGMIEGNDGMYVVDNKLITSFHVHFGQTFLIDNCKNIAFPAAIIGF